MADLKIVDEPVPEWPNEDGLPGIIRLRQLPAEEALALAWEMSSGNVEEGLSLLLVKSAIDEKGDLLFTRADIPRLRRKSLAVLDRLQRRCLELNAMSSGDAGAKVARTSPVTDPTPEGHR